MPRINPNIILILLFLLFAETEIHGQYFRNFSQDDGLSGSDVTAIVQDNYGFIWIGTNNGLNRYDGYSFKQYKKIPGDSASLYTNTITRLFIHDDDLWIGTVVGISSYNRETDNFTNYLYDKNASDCFYIMDILSDNEGNLITACGDGNIMRYNEQADQFEIEAEPGIYIIRLIVDKMNNFWIGNNDGLFYLDRKTGKIVDHYTLFKNATLPKKISVTSLFYEKNTLWIGTEKSGILKYNEIDNKYELVNNNNKFIFFTERDREGKLWVGDGNALYHFDELNNTLLPVPIFSGEDSDNIELGAECFMEDACGNIWIGLKYGGINQYLKKQNFENITYQKNSAMPLTKGNITAVLRDSEGKLWLGSFTSGVDVIDPAKNIKKTFTYDPGNPKGIGPGSVHCIFEDSERNIWIGSHQGGLQKYIRKTNDFIHYKHDPENEKSIGDNDVRSIIEDNNKNIWVASHGVGISKFNPVTGEFTNYLSNPSSDTLLSSEWTFDLLRDSDDKIWIAAAYGLTCIDNSGIFKKYFCDPDDTTTLTNEFVNTLYEDSKQRIWVGTIEGLNLYIKSTNTFRQYFNTENRNDNIQSILEDGNGNLWLGTNEGLTKFNPDRNEFRNYDVSDGLISSEFFINSASYGKHGKMIFGNVNGLVRFHPDSIKVDSFKVPVYITDFKIFNKSVPIKKGKRKNYLSKNIQLLDEIVVDYNQKVLTFEYVALNFVEPDKNKYAYMLEGFDKDWNHIGTKREVTYTNLNPGVYTFHVKACNHDGIWNTEGTSIRLVILPPFWKTLLFKIALSLLIVLLLFLAYMFRIRQIRLRNITLKHRVEERTKEISEMNRLLEYRQKFIEDQTVELKQQRDVLYEVNSVKDRLFTIIAHDLKSPFNTLLGFTRLLHENYDKFKEDKKKTVIKNIYETAEKTFELLENLFKWARAQQGIIQYNAKEIDLIELIKNNINLVQKQAQFKKIKIDFSNGKTKIVLKIDPDLINTVIRNIINNAIKFTPDGGRISIDVETLPEKVICSIRDNGKGISKENLDKLFKKEYHYVTNGTNNEKGTGIGLLMCKDFIDIHGGKIWAESEKGKGSVFYFSLPV